LLGELGIPSLLARGSAAALSGLFAAGGLSAHFKHVAPPVYINSAGAVDAHMADNGMGQNCESARESYRRSHKIGARVPLRDLADHAPINYV
jgi:hypothetical protein